MTKKEKMRLAGYSSEEIRELMSATRNQILSAEKCGDLLLAQNLSSDMNVLNEAREMKARGKLRVRQTTKKKADHKNQLDPNLLNEMERAGKIRKMKVSKEMNQHRM